MLIKHNGQTLVSPKIARDVKELGFNKPTFSNFTDENEIAHYDSIEYINENYNHRTLEEYLFNPCVNNYVEAPTTAQVVDWFRETFKLHLSINISVNHTQWLLDINFISQLNTVHYIKYSIDINYNTVLEEGIEKMIETIKSIKNNG